jgi:hypothetical protein
LNLKVWLEDKDRADRLGGLEGRSVGPDSEFDTKFDARFDARINARFVPHEARLSD